jgi:hypothetical protein
MNANEASQEIINPCEEVGGFLLKLQINMIFDAVENQARSCPVSVQPHLFERISYQFAAYHNHDGHTEPTFMTLEKHLDSL